MYLFREFSMWPALVLALLWAAGGWLISARLFDLKPVERHLVGFGIGLVAGNWLANLLSRFLPLDLACWFSALIVLIAGLALAWPIRADLPAMWSFSWGQWLSFGLLALLFTLINRGLAIFDDYAYLPSVSLMATGDIPPHFPFDTSLSLGYHYFLLLLGAQFMRVTGAAPWTALDLARGLTMSLYFLLGGLLAFRLTDRPGSQFWGGLFVALAGGTRWLLLLLPPSLVAAISGSLRLIGATGQNHATLQSLLNGPWLIEGSGPVPFPFAFVSGISQPAILALGGFGIFYGVILLVLILVAPHLRSPWAWPLIVILLSSLSLANEIFFVSMSAGLFLMAAFWAVTRRSIKFPSSLRSWMIAFASAALVAFLQGGALTDLAKSLLVHNATGAVYYETGFRLAWPPAIVSAHLGVLSLLQPLQLITALLEIGPFFLVFPLLLSRARQAFADENWFEAGLLLSSCVGLLTIFVEYRGVGGVRNTSRLFGYFLYLCLIYAVPLVWLYLRDKGQVLQNLALFGGLLAVLGGAVLLSIEFYAVSRPVASYDLDGLDRAMFEKYWNRLPESVRVFDPVSDRAVTVFGRPTDSALTWYEARPEFVALSDSPDPYQIHAAGYDYMYYNASYWLAHTSLLDSPCALVLDQFSDIHQATGEQGDFRRLVDIRACIH
jgi:hypothetical protein